MPERIQLRRTKGWRKPAGVIKVARPSKFGNPFTVRSALDNGFVANEADARKLVVSAFRSWLERGEESTWWFQGGARALIAIVESLHELRGHDLGCWCPLDQPCHADVLLELANGAA